MTSGESPKAEGKPRAGFSKLWHSFVEHKYHELTTLIFAFLALIGAAVSIVVSCQQANDQALAEATQSAFEVAVQATTQHQAGEQIRIQQAQTVLDGQLTELYRQQAFPYMKLMDDQVIITLSEVKNEPTVETSTVEGTGQLGFVLANDGGGQAGLVHILWGMSVDTGKIVSLEVAEAHVAGAGAVTLPVNIEGQSASRLDLQLNGAIAAPGEGDSMTPYQLGLAWAEAVEEAQTYLELQFSNADPLSIAVSEIHVDVPIQIIIPDPASPFEVTDADTLGQACFTLTVDGSPADDRLAQVRFLRLDDQRESDQVTLGHGDCLTFPVGDYEVSAEIAPDISLAQAVQFHVSSGDTAYKELSFHSSRTWNRPLHYLAVALLLFLLGGGSAAVALLRREVARLEIILRKHDPPRLERSYYLRFTRLRRTIKLPAQALGLRELVIKKRGFTYDIKVNGIMQYRGELLDVGEPLPLGYGVAMVILRHHDSCRERHSF